MVREAVIGMMYALIENGVVSNIISLTPQAASGFPDAVPCEECPVQIGDTYIDNRFYHDNELLLSYSERLQITEDILGVLYEGC